MPGEVKISIANTDGSTSNLGMVGNAVKSTEATYVVAVTPSDVTTYAPPLTGIRVGTTAGDVTVVSNGVTVTIPAVQLYESLQAEITQVLAATTAVGITGWQGS